MTRKICLAIFASTLLALAADAQVAGHYAYGRLTNVTSGAAGLLVMLDVGVPTNCTGTPYGWMVIPESNKTMIAVALITWQNKGSGTVYTDGISASGYCTVNQFDPAEQ
jgi:hypothetical protein